MTDIKLTRILTTIQAKTIIGLSGFAAGMNKNGLDAEEAEEALCRYIAALIDTDDLCLRIREHYESIFGREVQTLEALKTRVAAAHALSAIRKAAST